MKLRLIAVPCVFAALLAGCAEQRHIARGFERALQLQRTERYELALARYRQLLVLDRRLDGVLCNMGLIELRRRRPASAATLFHRALGINRDNLLGRYLLAISLARARLFERARRQVRRAIRQREQLIAQTVTRHGQPAMWRLDHRIADPAFGRQLERLERSLGAKAGGGEAIESLPTIMKLAAASASTAHPPRY